METWLLWYTSINVKDDILELNIDTVLPLQMRILCK